ncbi:MAG: DUF308 domain-containing protein [Methylovirgula sp.]|nr:DUF308 domain-containing protein [Methylovirgula sp.]
MSLPTETAPIPTLPAAASGCVERLRHRWAWFIVLGVLVAAMGVAALALVVSATIASVYIIALFMVIAGGGEIVFAFGARSWARFFLWVIAGLAYIVVAACALAQPLMAAAVFTLLLGVALFVTGVIRIYVGTQLNKDVRGIVILAGIVTSLVGLVVLIGWPANSFVVLGVLLGLDLLFWGGSWVTLGLRMKAHLLALPRQA